MKLETKHVLPYVLYGVKILTEKNLLDKNQPILIIHCGGLQGNVGYEERYNLNPNRKEMDAHG